MKAFITGGTGFIGSHLADRLIAEGGHTLRCMVRSKEKWLEGKPYERIRADLNDLPAIGAAMEGVDVVFHTAGVVKTPDTRTFENVNVDATENLLRLAIKHKVPKVVILSSQAAAGPSEDGIPVDENAPMRPVSRYGESKKRMEEMIHRLSDANTSVTIIRPSSVYGAREEDIYTMFKVAAKGIFPIVGKGRGKPISIAHVDDVVDGTLLSLKDTRKGVQTYFISSERGYDWHEISDATAIAMGKRMRRINIPEHIVKNVGTIAQSVASFFGRYPVMNEDKASEMVLSWVCSVDKAKKELGYRQKVSLEDGFIRTIDWYKRHKWL